MMIARMSDGFGGGGGVDQHRSSVGDGGGGTGNCRVEPLGDEEKEEVDGILGELFEEFDGVGGNGVQPPPTSEERRERFGARNAGFGDDGMYARDLPSGPLSEEQLQDLFVKRLRQKREERLEQERERAENGILRKIVRTLSGDGGPSAPGWGGRGGGGGGGSSSNAREYRRKYGNLEEQKRRQLDILRQNLGPEFESEINVNDPTLLEPATAPAAGTAPAPAPAPSWRMSEGERLEIEKERQLEKIRHSVCDPDLKGRIVSGRTKEELERSETLRRISLLKRLDAGEGIKGGVLQDAAGRYDAPAGAPAPAADGGEVEEWDAETGETKSTRTVNTDHVENPEAGRGRQPAARETLDEEKERNKEALLMYLRVVDPDLETAVECQNNTQDLLLMQHRSKMATTLEDIEENPKRFGFDGHRLKALKSALEERQLMEKIVPHLQKTLRTKPALLSQKL